ncbi:hypothetical protein HK103_002160 [Boothiomyces macroporosus]|uniref:Uncharacterized protein n=1 Tax=Boothiomyces macroporosus TaxID=261099 RepID=A0AAD5UJG9_9FUNG|nr:hypothetical protein HK103_002160 [Boothiomyces macroporosus]
MTLYIAATRQCINSNIICEPEGSLYVYEEGTECQSPPSIYSLYDQDQLLDIRNLGNVTAIMYTSVLASEQFGWIAFTPSKELVLGSFSDGTEITGIGFFVAAGLVMFYVVANNLFPSESTNHKKKQTKDSEKKKDAVDGNEIEKKENKDQKEVDKSRKEKIQVFQKLSFYSIMLWLVYISLECAFVFAQNLFVDPNALQLARRVFLNFALLSSTIEPVFLLQKYETTTKLKQQIIISVIFLSNIAFGGSYYFMLQSNPSTSLDALTRWSKAFQLWAITFFSVHLVIPAWVAFNFVAPIKTMTFTDRMHSIRQSSHSLISFTYINLSVLVIYVILQIVFLGTPALGNDKAVMATFGINFFFYILQYTITHESADALATLKIKLKKKKAVRRESELNSSKKSLSSRNDFAIARRPSIASQIQKDDQEKRTKDGKESKSATSSSSSQKDASTDSESQENKLQESPRKQRKSLANPEGLKIITRKNSLRSQGVRTPSVIPSPTVGNIKLGSDTSGATKETRQIDQKNLLVSTETSRRRGASLIGADNPMLATPTKKTFDSLEIPTPTSRRRSHQEAPSLEIPNGIGRKIDEPQREDKTSSLQSPARIKSPEYPLSPSSNAKITDSSTAASPPGRRKKSDFKSVDKTQIASDYKRHASSLRQEVINEGTEAPTTLLQGNAIFVSDRSISNGGKPDSTISPDSSEKKLSSFDSNNTQLETGASPNPVAGVGNICESLVFSPQTNSSDRGESSITTSPIPNIVFEESATNSQDGTNSQLLNNPKE